MCVCACKNKAVTRRQKHCMYVQTPQGCIAFLRPDAEYYWLPQAVVRKRSLWEKGVVIAAGVVAVAVVAVVVRGGGGGAGVGVLGVVERGLWGKRGNGRRIY